MTARRRGGGHKLLYRMVDFKRRKFDMPAKVARLEYDPNRSAFIALIEYEDGEQSYILAPQRLAVGDTVIAGQRADIKPGNAMPLGSIPVGTIVHNVRSEEHTSELQSLMRISYAVFCLQKKKNTTYQPTTP